MNRLSLTDMLQEISPMLERKTSIIQSSVNDFFNEELTYIIFLSATDEKQRARVVQARATTYEKAWEEAVQKLRRILMIHKVRPEHVKADIVTSIETVPFHSFMTDIAQLRKNYLRKGIAFDRLFQHAFLEQEMNANVFFNNWEHGNINIAVQHIAEYSELVRDIPFRINFNQLEEVHLFETTALFHDGTELYELNNGLYNNGTRMIDTTEVKNISSILEGATNYVMEHTNDQGEFRYINFPAFHKGVDTYNILHHASTVYALIEVYQTEPTSQLLETIERTLQYIVDYALVKHDMNGTIHAFIVEKVEDNAIKLGVNAYVLLAMTTYIDVIHRDTFTQYVEMLANGILYMQKRDGDFDHVLHDDLTLKDALRAYTYNGEAILSLISLYNITEDRKWLMAAERSFRYTIKNDYWKHGDPFLNEAAYLIYKVRPHAQYATFNLQSAKHQLSTAFIIEEERPLLLRHLLATYYLIAYIKEQDIQLDELNEFPLEKLHRAIHFRVTQQMNSYLWPEMAMYYSKPNQITNSFYVRHDSYRIQMNDIADNIVSLLYYEQYLHETKGQFEVEKQPDNEAILLLNVRQLERQNKREEAIDLLKGNLDSEEQWLDNTYALYASLYRLNGQMELTKEIIGRGNTIYPQSETILVEFLNLCMAIHNYHAARVVAEDLIKINPTEGKYYFELGRALAETKEEEKAKSAFKIGLIYHHNMSTEQLISNIQNNITAKQGALKSVYTYLGGMNNLGAMVHENKAEKYFTKITRIDKGAQREAIFYRDVQAEYPLVKEVTPTFFGIDTFDGVHYLTIEHINALKESIKIEQMIEVVQKLSTIPYASISEKFPNPSYPFVMRKNVGPDIIYLFTKIHDRKQNELLLSTAKIFAQEYAYPDEVKEMLHTIEKMIFDKELYKQISPEKHYSLLHGDLKLNNMVLSEKNKNLYVIDWGSFTIGPRFVDMALLFSNISTSYETIIEKYINNIDEEKTLSDVEQFYFGFAYFLTSFVKITHNNVNHIYTQSLLPAMEYMEECFDSL